MKAPHRIVSALTVILVALLAGFFFLSASRVSTHAADVSVSHDPHQQRADHIASGSVTEVDALHDAHALGDMFAYATLHLGSFRELPETFGGTSEWSDAWDLHWIDVVHDGEVLRIYNLSAKHHPDQGFVTIWDSREGHWTAWEAAQ